MTATCKRRTHTTGETHPCTQRQKPISGHFDKTVHYQLKRIALENDTTIQDLFGEALHLLFEQYNNH